MNAQDPDEKEQDKEAKKSLEMLKKTPPKLLKLLDLTPEEAAKTTRGKKLKVFDIGLDKLKTFKTGDNTKKILVDTKEIVYPIYVGSKLKTSISIRKSKNGGKWQNASIGGGEIHFLEPSRMKHSKLNKISLSAYFVVRVPALYLSFLGYHLKGKLYFIPTHEHPDVELVLDKGTLAEEIYVKLQPLVDKFKDVLKRGKNEK
jgi:hypothetical protein